MDTEWHVILLTEMEIQVEPALSNQQGRLQHMEETSVHVVLGEI